MPKPESKIDNKIYKVLRNKWITVSWLENPDQVLINKEKSCHLVDFADHKVIIKESEGIDKYLDLDREIKKKKQKKKRQDIR